MSGPWLLYELTRGCNRSCVYCYNRDSRQPSAEELSPAHLDRLLDRLPPDGLPAGVTIIGGEPLTVGQLEETVRGFVRRGLRVGVSTNGLLLDRQRLARLVEAGVSGVEISLDSPVEATYRALTRAPGLQRVRLALTELAHAEMPVTVGAMLTRANVGELGDLLTLCFALSVGRVVLNQLAPVGRARGRMASLALTDGELAAALSLADERSAALGLRVGIGLPVEPCRIDRAGYLNLDFEACRCGQDKWVLEPSGRLRTCELSDEEVGNLFETPFSELAASEVVASFRRANLCADCRDCPHWEACRGGCRFLR